MLTDITWIRSSWGVDIEFSKQERGIVYRIKSTGSECVIEDEMNYTKQGILIEKWLRENGVSVDV